MSEPLVTVLLPMHNNAATVGEAVVSVLSQTVGDFELLVLDDASSDGGAACVRAFGDERVRVVRNEERREIAGTLNRGLELARGKYIARMDADDVCLPERFARQVAFLEEHAQIGVVGCFVQSFLETGDGPRWEYPTEPGRAAAGLLFRCTLAHPAVMMRRELLVQQSLRYDAAFRRAQDYDLWFRCVQAGVGISNVPEVLLRYRLHAAQATRREEEVSLAAAANVRGRVVRWLGISPTEAELALHETLSMDRLREERAYLAAAINWLERLADANEATGRFEREAFLRTLTGRYVALKRRGAAACARFEPFVR